MGLIVYPAAAAAAPVASSGALDTLVNYKTNTAVVPSTNQTVYTQTLAAQSVYDFEFVLNLVNNGSNPDAFALSASCATITGDLYGSFLQPGANLLGFTPSLTSTPQQLVSVSVSTGTKYQGRAVGRVVNLNTFSGSVTLHMRSTNVATYLAAGSELRGRTYSIAP